MKKIILILAIAIFATTVYANEALDKERVREVMIERQRIEGYATLAIYIMLIGITALSWVIRKKYVEKYKAETDIHKKNSAKDNMEIATTAAAAITIITLMVIMGTLSDTINSIVNPEYEVIKQITNF
ncbi:MAG: hypothetical protein ACOC1K_07890 [Nanoarchaeota archaeon]